MPERQQIVTQDYSIPAGPPEEAKIVRIIDLEHVKRDIGDIPDGQGRFDNAFWGFLGCGVPLIIQGAISVHTGPGVLQLILGIFLVAVACFFLYFARDQKNKKTRAIKIIRENIDDFSKNIQVADQQTEHTQTTRGQQANGSGLPRMG